MKKDTKLLLLVSSVVLTLYLTLKSTGLIAINCPFSYLNPWQYFFSCTGFDMIIYAAIFLVSFAAAFLIIKKKK
jgi:hypothetical protein